MSMGNIDCYLHVVPETIVKKVVGKRIYVAYKKAYKAVTRDPSECTDEMQQRLNRYTPCYGDECGEPLSEKLARYRKQFGDLPTTR